MCILTPPSPNVTPAPTSAPAQRLSPPQRQQLALDALAGQPISQLAQQHDVSRKFIYQQLDCAHQGLTNAFAPAPEDDAVLFYLPVTHAWLRQLVLALVLICHSSLRGVVELLRDLFDYALSLGTAHNILHEAVTTARTINAGQELSRIRIGAHDELFQVAQPVLVGADVHSTYCYLLSLEEHRDADTWGVRLLELHDRGFDPEATIADAGSGLRAGQKLALPQTPCRGDVFHAFQELAPVVTYLENRAYEAIAARSKLDHHQAQFQRRHGRSNPKLSQKLRYARPAEAQAITLADEVAVLVRWLQQDILAVAGPSAAERRALYDFILAELRARASLCPHRLGPVCTLLQNQRDELLAFAAQLDRDLEALAQEFQVSGALVRELLHVQALEHHDRRRCQREAAVRQQLRHRFHGLSAAVADVARNTVRASSVIENLNSRLRNYFFLRRHLGPDYLALLQFFLNHRRFMRSEHPERVGKSPAELLTGQPHRHWLEMLGFTRFGRG